MEPTWTLCGLHLDDESGSQRRQSGLKSGGRGSMSQKFQFFQTNFRKISIFSGNFTKNFDFSRQNFRKISIFSRNFTKCFDFYGEMSHLQQLLGKLFYFSSKVTTFEHTFCT